MAVGVVAQQRLLQGCGHIDVGGAEKAGEIVGDGTTAHALVVDHYGARVAEQDIARLPVAVDQALGEAARSCAADFNSATTAAIRLSGAWSHPRRMWSMK